jgi:hypothetical protein
VEQPATAPQIKPVIARVPPWLEDDLFGHRYFLPVTRYDKLLLTTLASQIVTNEIGLRKLG